MNQYDFTRPVGDPERFFGRREIRREVLDGVRRGASFAIIGGTRIGKTSLLFQVRHALLEQLKGPQNAVIGPVFLSTHEFPRLSQSIIYRRVVEEFRATLSIPGADEVWRQGVRLFDRNLEEDYAFDAFRQALDTIFQSRDVVRRIVIMIDEVDELRRYEWSHSFFNNLRHLISQTTAGERIAIVIAGTLAIRSLYEVAGSPFLNVIQGTKSLDLLSRAETDELVGRPSGYRLEPSVVGRIYTETGGHPFLTQYLMKYLCDQFPDRLEQATERDVMSIVERYFRERTDFEVWVSDFTDAERQAYHRIESSPQGASRADLVALIGDPKVANHAIRMLTHIGVTREERPGSNRYLVGGDMFRRWFNETFDLTKPAVVPPARTTSPAAGTDPRVQIVKVFVASPGDVQAERNAVQPVLDEINGSLGRQLKCVLKLIRWETDVYPDVSAGGPQAVVDAQVDVADCDVVVGIFAKRYGTPTPFGESGSAHEIMRACEAALKQFKKKPHVMVYFSDQVPALASLEEVDEYRKVVELRERLKTIALCETFSSVQNFTDLVRKHLSGFIQSYVTIG